MKHYQLKQKIKFKAYCNDCYSVFTPEPLTTQCCSMCGNLNKDVGNSNIYHCNKCLKSVSRDMNSSKIMIIKGIQESI